MTPDIRALNSFTGKLSKFKVQQMFLGNKILKVVRVHDQKVVFKALGNGVLSAMKFSKCLKST